MRCKNGETRQCGDTNRASIENNRVGNVDMKSLPKAAPNFTKFKFGKSEVRVVTQVGEPWFVAEDVCKALKLTNPTMSLKSLDDDERSKFNLGRQGEANVISESGMFTLVLRCRDAVKPGSVPHQFRKWVTGEVLPAIRKTGSYQAEPSVPAVKETKAENRYRIRVIIYDELFGGCVEFFGKANTFRAIASGVATDMGYKPTGFVDVGMDKEKMRRIY